MKRTMLVFCSTLLVAHTSFAINENVVIVNTVPQNKTTLVKTVANKTHSFLLCSDKEMSNLKEMSSKYELLSQDVENECSKLVSFTEKQLLDFESRQKALRQIIWMGSAAAGGFLGAGLSFGIIAGESIFLTSLYAILGFTSGSIAIMAFGSNNNSINAISYKDYLEQLRILIMIKQDIDNYNSAPRPNTKDAFTDENGVPQGA